MAQERHWAARDKVRLPIYPHISSRAHDHDLDSGVDGGMKFRPSPQELRTIGPEFTERWKTFFTCAPDKPLLWFGMLAQ